MDPTIWAGLATLVVLEIVLGIDNLVFIAILVEKVSAKQRDRARIIGLILALIMRIILLIITGWVATLTTPLFTVAGISFSGRQLIMLVGGIFLLFKATSELNERLEGNLETEHKQKKTSHFWTVVAQIVVLDAVFSLDAVITAVGMVEHLPVMIAAVCIAMALMIMASKPLAQFVNSHPTIVILCLSFLLMIGFSLAAEGFGFYIPKGYLYAAIGFSIMIEAFNQLASFNRRRFLSKNKSLRQRTAEAVLHMLRGNIENETLDSHTADMIADSNQEQAVFNQQELSMVERVFGLAQRSVSSIMTPRQDIDQLNLDDEPAQIQLAIMQNQHSRLIVTDDQAGDEPIGIINVNDLLKQNLSQQPFELKQLIKQPLIFPETVSLLVALEQFRQGKAHFAFVVDEFGSVQGIVSVTDIIETIAGELPTEAEPDDTQDLQQLEENVWVANGTIALEELTHTIPIPLDEKREYHTLAGLLIELTQQLPIAGESITIGQYQLEVLEVESHRIVKVKITQLPTEANPQVAE